MKKTLLAIAIIIGTYSCDKSPVEIDKSPLGKQPPALIIDWTNLHIRLIRNTTGVSHIGYSRHFAYTGVALYESLVNGDHKKKSIAPLLNGLTCPPPPSNENKIFYPLAANAVFADMFRYFYVAKQNNVQWIDSLEMVYKNKYTMEVTNHFNVEQSIEYGRKIAAAVIEWSKLDGATNAATPYTPLGEGYWEPTAPAFGAAALPGWGNNRIMLPASINGVEPPAPIPFSKEQGSPFYNMVKEVYDVSLSRTDEQKAIANFWDDLPNGTYISAYGHWFNILKQILQKENTPLMKGAEAYLRLGITMHEATISCWKSKYKYSQIRPISYIRKYMGAPAWNSFIGTPAHPEYLAAHATLSGSAAYALETVFGKNYAFTDHTYQDLGMMARHYNSIDAAGTEAGMSRLYGGIHYRPSIVAGKVQGDKVGANVKILLKTNR